MGRGEAGNLQPRDFSFDLIEDANEKDEIADFTSMEFPAPISFEHFTAERPLPGMRLLKPPFRTTPGSRTPPSAATLGSITQSSPAMPGSMTSSSGDADFSCSPGTSKASSGIVLARDAFGHVSFQGAIFDGRAVFTNRKFIQPAHFQRWPLQSGSGILRLRHPSGHYLPGREFLDKGKGNVGVDAVKAYRTLKLAMESLRDRPNEAKFFALEQVALRTTKQLSRWERVLSHLHSVSSNYGQSSFQPFLWLLLTTLFFSYVYYVYGCVLDVPIDVVQASLEALFNPFGAFRPGTKGEGYPRFVQFLMLLQSLLSFVWITLFLLALRRRFKLD